MKALRIIYIVLLYLMQALLVTAVAILLHVPDVFIQDMNPVFLVALILGIIAIGVGIAYMIVAFLSCLKPAPHPFRDGLVFKLIMVPFFIVNFYLCALLFAGLLNPWLAWSVFAVVPLLIFLTYLVLLVTSAYSLGMMVRTLITKKGKGKFFGWQIALHLIFVADVVSAFILRRWEHQGEVEDYWAKQEKEKRALKDEETTK